MRAIGKKIGTDMVKGSALILTIVLCTLLALVGVVFLIMSRADRDASSSISQDKQLQSAVGSTIAVISERLVQDVPQAGQEYYDYPDVNNTFLASLEPYQDGSYYWRQVSDITGTSVVEANLPATIIPDYQDINDVNDTYPADADGDGVADARWVRLPNMATDRGEPVFAAVRIVDNGGMINVNTGYKFDSNDGSSQAHINFLALSDRGSISDPLARLDANRMGDESVWDLDKYIQDVVLRPERPQGKWTPFDIGDELKLRNRYILNYNLISTRIENLWTKAYDGGLEVPRTQNSQLTDPNGWFYRTNNSSPNPDDYDYRHISTTYNIDRVINPAGAKMVNVNTADEIAINAALLTAGLDDANAAQIAVNIVDARDSDADTTAITVGTTYYGFDAQPFISEIAFKIDSADPANSANNRFAVELYNPFSVNIPLEDFQVVLEPDGIGTSKTVSFPAGTEIPANSCFVVYNTSDAIADLGISPTSNTLESADCVLAEYIPNPAPPPATPLFILNGKYDVEISKNVGGVDLYIDKQKISPLVTWDWDSVPKDIPTYYARNDEDWNIVYQDLYSDSGSLGTANGRSGAKHNYNLWTSGEFKTVGDVLRVMTIGPNDVNEIGFKLKDQPVEWKVRLNIAEPNVAKVFQYLTVFDPTSDGVDNDGVNGIDDPNEIKIAGRININTAPWYVIAQLPWMQYEDLTSFEKAKAICDYRDKTGSYASRAGEAGFGSVGELMQVSEMLSLDSDGKDNLNSETPAGPDFTDDTAMDDLEERDLIFARVSNLATVRSDVFTAYILVRLGQDGPQKRVVAILDRSGAKLPTDRVRIIAVQDVPDPR